MNELSRNNEGEPDGDQTGILLKFKDASISKKSGYTIQ